METQDDGPSFGEVIVDVWNTGVFGVDLGRILSAALILVLCLTLRHWIAGRLRRWAEYATRRTANQLDDKVGGALAEPISFVPVVLGVFLAFEILSLSGTLNEVGVALSRSLIAFTLFWAMIRLTGPLAHALSWVEDYLTPELTAWFIKAVKVAIWFVGAATILEIWGIRVLPIIAGFGLIGVAVALGAQDLFKNLISGVLILVEKRYRVGDWIKVEGVVEGVVEAIGFRSTKVRRFDKAPVYVPNTHFADGAVVNFGEMTHRRIFWTIGLEYRTTAAQLQRIRDEIERYILEDDRYLAPKDAGTFVRLDAFSGSSIDLMLYCFTRTRDWGEWLAIKEELLLRIKQIVEEAGAGFAFPSRSLYVENAESLGAALAPPEASAPPKPKAVRSRSGAGAGKSSASKAAPGGAAGAAPAETTTSTSG